MYVSYSIDNNEYRFKQPIPGRYYFKEIYGKWGGCLKSYYHPVKNTGSAIWGKNLEDHQKVIVLLSRKQYCTYNNHSRWLSDETAFQRCIGGGGGEAE